MSDACLRFFFQIHLLPQAIESEEKIVNLVPELGIKPGQPHFYLRPQKDTNSQTMTYPRFLGTGVKAFRTLFNNSSVLSLIHAEISSSVALKSPSC